MCTLYIQSTFNKYLCILIPWEMCLLAFGNEGCTQILDAQMDTCYIVIIKSSDCPLFVMCFIFLFAFHSLNSATSQSGIISS